MTECIDNLSPYEALNKEETCKGMQKTEKVIDQCLTTAFTGLKCSSESLEWGASLFPAPQSWPERAMGGNEVCF